MKMDMNKRILVIDDEKKIREILNDILEHDGYRVSLAGNGEEALTLFEHNAFDLVLLDLSLPGMDGMEVLRRITRLNHYLPVIIISAFGNIPIAVEAVHLGAVDFIEKPVDMNVLLERISKWLNVCSDDREQNREIESGVEKYGIVGISHEVKSIFQTIDQVASTNVKVLISGDTGTGKELVARAIHKLSPRFGEQFIKLNCAAIPSELIESELFGHRRGAFTGAMTDKSGKFQLAHKGTLFLDEIGDMSPLTQAKVLRALETGEVYSVGATEPFETDVRIIAATNKDLDQAVQSGQFREDLLYRLNVVTIHIPKLRDRKEDIPYLVRFFVQQFCEEHNRMMKRLAPGAVEVLVFQPWPGNVRQLRNFIEKLVIFVGDEIISAAHVHALLGFKQIETDLISNQTIRDARLDFEREFILSRLITYDWDVAKTSELLGMERTALYRKIKQLGIELIAK